MGGVVAPWYLKGGVASANCIAAYKAKGAASYAASKINLANPGTYDAADGAAFPSWAAATGWTFNGTTQYLDTGVVPVNDQTWSMIVKYNSYTTGAVTVCGMYEDVPGIRAFLIQVNDGGDLLTYYNGNNTSAAPHLHAATLAIGGTIAYRDGVPDGAAIGAIPGVFVGSIYIGAVNYDAGTAAGFLPGVITSLAIYDAVLTEAQVVAIGAEMA